MYKILFTVSIVFQLSTILSIPIHDVSKVQTADVKQLYKPYSCDELRTIVVNTQGLIAIAGGRYSQGGHVWVEGGTVIDMINLNKIIELDIERQTITVEAGIRWCDIQRYITPHGLAVTVMQSYNDFTVGGSLSVNVHGRDIAHGPLIETVLSMKIMLANGDVVCANRTENYDLFQAVIGGYGSCGIILETTLMLTQNTKIERVVEKMTIKEYSAFFLNNVYKNPQIIFHNANLYPNELQEVLSVTWYTTDRSVTIQDQLMPIKKMYAKEMLSEQLLRRIALLKKYRSKFESKFVYTDTPVVWRNYEMSATVASLEPLMRFPTTTVLQEYFIPLNNLELFVSALREVIRAYSVNMINVSIRYVPQNTESILSYAQQESFSLVLYINFLNTQAGYFYAQRWAQVLIDHAYACQGTYYLPYQLFSTKEQFEKVYPRYDELKTVKQKYDPSRKFSNSFIQKYLS